MNQTNEPSFCPIAIVGVGSIFPGRGDVTGFWRDLFEGRDLISDVPPTHWLVEDYYDPDPRTRDRTYGRRGGFLSPVAFDPVTFGLPPKAMQGTDSAQLLALIVAKRTLEDIDRDSGGKIDKARTSVILGVASATELTAHMAGRLQRPVWVNAMRGAGLAESEVQDIAARIGDHYAEWQEATFPGLLGNVVAGRIANRLDLGGSNYVTDAACASTLSALQIALHELRSGDSDTVLTGGVDALNDILMFMCFSKTPALSPTGDCRPFSSNADGTMLGEGVGMMALRRLSDAERDGNTIHAVIRGLGGASDGKGTAIYSPLANGQARALTRAYQQAGYDPRSVDLVEGHGTGTKAGDKAELEGLHMVFGSDADTEPWCALGSVKSQIGHSKAAAGAASLIKTVGALSRKVLPPTLKIEEPAAIVRDSSAFYLNTEARPWVAAPDRPRRASVSSFGFGGSNFHVTMEEYTGKRAVHPYRTLPAELFLCSAVSADALAISVEALGASEMDDAALAVRAGATHGTFDACANARAAIVAVDAHDLLTKASALAQQIRDGELQTRPMKLGCHANVQPAVPGKVAFLFSGQGSQYVGMGADIAMAFPAALEVWNQAAGHSQVGAMRLDQLAFPPAPTDQIEFAGQTRCLTEMQHAQPAIAAVALSQLALLKQLGLTAEMTGGHSFGEIMALHYARVMSAKTALSVAATRGQLMVDAASRTKGGMLAVQTDWETVQAVLDKVGETLVLANDNGPSQVVLSGSLEAIDAAAEVCRELKLKAYRLPVATAFHSVIVESAAAPFEEMLGKQKIRKPKLDVYSNATAQPYAAKVADLPAVIASQLASPVRFRTQIEAMYEAGARIFVEIGPGAIVTGLVQNILGDRDYQAVALDNKSQNGVTQLLSTIGALSVAGRDLDIQKLFKSIPAQPETPVPSKHAVMISGANYGKPYPPKEGAAGRAPKNPNKAPKPAAIASDTATQPPQISDITNRTVPAMSDQDPASIVQPTPAVTTTQPAAPLNERVWLEVSQRHSEYLAATSAAHTAFLNMASMMMGVTPVAAAPVPTIAPPAPIPAPIQVASVSPVTSALNGATQVANGHDTVPPPVQAQPQAAVMTVVPAPEPQTQAVDAVARVRTIIADKTGYPEDMLEPDMDLEGELGVDSIKQVEILSTLREQLPDLPEIDPDQLVELRTIAAIAGMIEGHIGAKPASMPTSNPPESVTNGAVNVDTVRAIIADKTGYPVDMLEEDMDLEGELGVDSIKQVEILSALRDAHPSLPEIDPEVLAELRTIKAIAYFFA